MTDQTAPVLSEGEWVDPLVAAVYEFLVSENYHGHYPTAEEQAEKCVAEFLGLEVERIRQQAVREALAEVEALADEFDGRAKSCRADQRATQGASAEYWAGAADHLYEALDDLRAAIARTKGAGA